MARSQLSLPVPGFEEVDRASLIGIALSALSKAYAPYSHFSVAAAALFSSGTIYTGVNVENASYPAGICAERNAIFHAVAEGEKRLRAIAIVAGKNGIPGEHCTPCGICRQVMREFGKPNEILVILAQSPTQYTELTLEDLLPRSFGPEDLLAEE